MTAPRLIDAGARARIREDLDTTLVVEAAAGTGKTTELVARVLEVVASGAAPLRSIAAVTFTDKAAGEMKLRLRSAIEKARMDPATPPERRARLEQALGELEIARMGTIHALCSDLLRERPVEARVDPAFEVLPEERANRVLAEAFERHWSRTLAAPGPAVKRFLRRRPHGLVAEGHHAALFGVAQKLAHQRDHGAAWRRDRFDRDAEIQVVLDALARVAPLADRADREEDLLARCFAKVKRFLSDVERMERVRGRDADGLEAELAALARAWEWNRTWKSSMYGKGLARVDVLAERDAAKAALDRFVERSGADLAVGLREELSQVVAEYEDLKRRAGALDFLDLLVSAAALLRGRPDVRVELARRISRIFVDEFQDTDPLQAEILLLLSADDPNEADASRVRPVPGKLFVVGDPKQSIYRFRRADVALYERVKEQLVSSGAAVLQLTTSFRSAPALQQAVNAAFEPVMKGGGTQAAYVPLAPFRQAPEGRPSIVALPVPRPYGDWGDVVKKQVAESAADAVGAFVDWLLTKSGWTVSEAGKSEPVRVEARHVCLLFKRFQSFREDITRPYVRALEARRVPHVLVGGHSYHGREEVLAIRTALSAIEWPGDELSVYAALRGPLFAITDDVLLAWRTAAGPLHPLRRVDLDAVPAVAREVADALELLARLHARRNHRSIADTVSRLLEATRAHAAFAIWPTGEQALANVLRILDLGRRFEAAQRATSFRSFVEHLEREAETGHAADAPVVEEGTDGVRMMTVHRAKGLEFPVVVLVDPTAPARHERPSRWTDPQRRLCVEPLAGLVPTELAERADEVLARDEEEAQRVAYVAATRARDLLVVPVVGDERVPGWYDALFPALYPPRSRMRSPKPAPGCPPFGTDSVVHRPARCQRDERDAVAPGLHVPEVGQHEVVWWDPSKLELDRIADAGLRQQRILAADESGAASDAGERAHARWQDRRRDVLARGGVPSMPMLTVTELAASVPDGAPAPADVSVERTDAPREGRPRGKRFGTLVHALLAEVDLGAGDEDVARAAALVGRLLGATSAEVAAAASAATAALSHPLLVRAAASHARGACRRETPIVAVRDDGSLVEGVVDLAFSEPTPSGAQWTVVDFKTDLEIEHALARYGTQVGAYAAAIAAATGDRAVGVLLCV